MPFKEKILRFARSRKAFTTADVVDFCKKKFSRQYIQRILNDLLKEGVIVKIGNTKGTIYAAKEHADSLPMRFEKTYSNENLQEHVVWQEIKDQMPFLEALSENVYNILFYAFSEMLNNAIDHSLSREILVILENKDEIHFQVRDWGIGIFQSIMNKNPDFKSPKEVIQELLKGKLTTDPKRHSGEGIFFTSKVCESFVLYSEYYQLRAIKNVADGYIEYGAFQVAALSKGTQVFATIKKSEIKSLNDVFSEYYSNPAELDFDKTEVKIKLYTVGRACISRSQAKRVLNRLENFKKVILDFEGVTAVGQGFADEIFRIFVLQNPDIDIEAVGMNASVKFMVDRAWKKIKNL